MTGFLELTVENPKLVETHDVRTEDGLPRTWIRGENNHGERCCPPKYRVGTGPLPYMAMKMAEINGDDPITTETSVLGAHPPTKGW